MTPTFGAMEGSCHGLVGPDCRLLARPPCRTQASSLAASVRTLGLPALAHGQLSSAKWTVFRESRLSPAWQRGRQQARWLGQTSGQGATCPVQPAPWPGPAFTAFPLSTEVVPPLPSDSSGKGCVSPIRLPRAGPLPPSHSQGQGFVSCRLWGWH